MYGCNCRICIDDRLLLFSAVLGRFVVLRFRSTYSYSLLIYVVLIRTIFSLEVLKGDSPLFDFLEPDLTISFWFLFFREGFPDVQNDLFLVMGVQITMDDMWTLHLIRHLIYIVKKILNCLLESGMMIIVVLLVPYFFFSSSDVLLSFLTDQQQNICRFFILII
jgi:hypothetical protein